MDDNIITVDDIFGIAQVKVDLGKTFDVKNLEFLWYFLGIEVARNNRGIRFGFSLKHWDARMQTSIITYDSKPKTYC